MRVVRFLSGRTVVKDDATVLNIIPVFPGESVAYIQADGYVVALSDSDVSNPNELNWYGIGIPWGHVLSTTGIAKRTLGAQLTSVVLWDNLFEEMMLDTSQDGTEYYGGDVDADPEIVTGEETPGDTSDEELIDSGPTGPYRWFKREVLTRTHVAAGNATTRGGDEFRGSIGGGVRKLNQGQILMFGMVRHEIDAQTDFNVEMDDTDAIQAMALLMMGDYTKITNLVRNNTGTLGDYIRTTLYGGDSFIEASTMVGTSMKAYTKLEVGIIGPLDRNAVR